MIRSYIANIQIRLQLIENCIGDVQKYREQGVKQVKAKNAQFISKLHKDTQRKFQKIKKAIQRYGDILDVPTTPKQKLQILSDDFQQLKQLSVHLDKIQKLLPNLKTDHFLEIRQQGQNIDYFLTSSQINEGQNNSVKIIKYDQKSLYEMRNQHRQDMNQLLELNKRVVNNLNAKLEALIRKIVK